MRLPAYAVVPGDVVSDYGRVAKVEPDRETAKVVLTLDSGMRCVFGQAAIVEVEENE